MNPNKVTWVILGPGDNEATCQRCQQKHTFQLPAVVTEFQKDLDSFAQLHSRCLAPEPTPVTTPDQMEISGSNVGATVKKGDELKVQLTQESPPCENFAPRRKPKPKRKAKKRRKKKRKGGRR